MRIAKKVLAIVLAIVMVVGSFVIATSAADDKKIYLSLKAQVMAGTGVEQSEAQGLDSKVLSGTLRASAFSKQTTDITNYKSTKDSLEYFDSNDTIVVNPGDMIWVTTHLRSTGGVYPDAVQGQVFYDTDMFATVLALPTAAFVWNESNEIYAFSNSTLSGGVIYARMTQDFRDEYTPADFDDATDAKYNQYTWFTCVDPNAILTREDYPEMVAAQNSDLVTFPVYVRSDVEPGQTGTIFTYSYNKLSGTYLPASDYSAEFGMGDVYEQPIGYGPEMFDLSAATLNFVVAGGEAELDYTELNAQIADYESRSADAYTTDTWANATTAYDAAKALVDAAENQDAIDTAAGNLKTALANLEAKPVLSYDRINAAIASVPADLSVYTTSTASAVAAPLAAANTAVESATTQTELDNAAAALETAVANLAQKANFTDLNNALAEAANVTNIGYTAETWAEFEAALAAAQAFDQNETAVTSQANVTAAANRLYTAIDELEVEIVLDLTKWDAALAKQPADLSGYTPASVASYEAAVANATAAFNAAVEAKDQAGIDEAAADLEAAIALLAAVADKTALQAAIADAPEYASEMYSNWADYEAALVSANEVNDDANASQAAVDSATEDLVKAKAALVLADADYSAVEAAKDKAPADYAGYTAASAKEVQDAIAAVAYGYKKTQQADVDAMAAAIETAIAGLEALADYSAVEAAIASVPADTSIYTDASVENVTNAVNAVVYGLGETQQAEVDAFADAINTAVANLVEKDADYSAVEAALAKVEALNRALYTAASLADVDYAVAQVVEGKKISAQADVDAMAAAIETALDNLDLKPTEGYVQETTATSDVPYAANTFSIKVSGRPNKVRFVDFNNNDLTVTFSREKAREVGSIVSFNAAGEVVNDLSRDIAYEIWTVSASFNAGTYYVNAKDNDGWEALDLSYIFEYKFSSDDKEVKSVEAVDTNEAAAGEFVYMTVKTGADVLKVQTVVNGSVATFSDRTVENGVATFTVAAKAYAVGDNTVSFNIKTADGWEAVDATFVIVGK